jgi:hypothetical protein
LRIVFTWRAVTTNTGDAYASPAALFPWPDTTVVPLGEPIPPADAVV